MTGVTLDWANPHRRCIEVDVGTEVVWNGNFTVHPLDGGEAGTTDPQSPITLASPTGMNKHVTFTAAGTYPYYCTNHQVTMKGVVYVTPTGAGGGGGAGGGTGGTGGT
jgi:plastocyanin